MTVYNFFKIKDDDVFMKVVNSHYMKYIYDPTNKDKYYSKDVYPWQNRTRFDSIVKGLAH